MSEPSDFLARWSRRKRAAAEPKGEPQTPLAQETAKETAQENAQEARAPAQEQTRGANRSVAPAETELDLASLPPLDSIKADTDIRGFLKPGVPAGLRDAALRRAWSADPAIRDFRGLQENDWDFNDPGAMSGFGKLAPGFDLREMAAQIVGDEPNSAEPHLPTGAQAVPTAQISGETHDREPVTEASAAETASSSLPSAQEEMAQREENVATRQDEPADSIAQNKPRRHGGALPREVPE